MIEEKIRVLEATVSDICDMNVLSRKKRKLYEKEQPNFWKWAGESGEESQRNWFQQLLSNENYVLLVAKNNNNELVGFIIGEIKSAPDVYSPSGKTLLVDDFCVSGNQWTHVGKSLLSSLKENPKAKEVCQIIIVCGAQDKSKSDFLCESKLNIVSNWYMGY